MKYGSFEPEDAMDPEDPNQARLLLIRLLDEGDYRVTDRARNEGLPILRMLGFENPLEGSLVQYVVDLLRGSHPIHRMIRGEPPDSLPRGWGLRNCDGQGLFIELIIEERKMGQPEAWLISFHR